MTFPPSNMHMIVAHFSQSSCFPKINKQFHTESALNLKCGDGKEGRGLDTIWFCMELVEHSLRKIKLCH